MGNISPGSQSPVPSWKNTQGQHLILSRHPRVIPSILQVLDPGKETVTLSPLNQREHGKEQSLWQKQIPETTGCEHHITLFLWFSNFTFGQCKASLSLAWPLCGLTGDRAWALRSSTEKWGLQGLRGPQQMHQAPASRAPRLSPPALYQTPRNERASPQ